MLFCRCGDDGYRIGGSKKEVREGISVCLGYN